MLLDIYSQSVKDVFPLLMENTAMDAHCVRDQSLNTSWSLSSPESVGSPSTSIQPAKGPPPPSDPIDPEEVLEKEQKTM